MPQMAAEKPKDRHKPALMIRLPESHRAPLAALKEKQRRSGTVIVQLAMEEYYRKHKIPFPSGGVSQE
jgi:hypothetical protein